MFDLDKWQEIFDTLSKNKLRTFLTAFSVSWGILMLILLLGFGNGLQHGTEQAFAGDASNSIWFNGGETSVGYKGMNVGRKIRLDNDDRELLAQQDGVNKAGSRKTQYETTVTYKENSTSIEVLWIHPDYRFLEQLIVATGRALNEQDYLEAKKVVILGKEAVSLLFPHNEEPLAKDITINGVSFKVVGTFDDPGGDRDNRRLYIPITTGQKAFGGQKYVDGVNLLTKDITLEGSKQLEAKITKELKQKYNIAPEDNRALRVWNNLEGYQQIMGIFSIIRAIVWVVGIMTLMAGIIGVANIMMITVKERTREIGIRKAMGATPGSILAMIMQEAILITAVSGYTGLIIGVWLLDSGLLLQGFSAMGIPTDYIKNPSVDFGTAVTATIILIVAGTLAGLFPAIRAANINPMTAIRDA